MFYETVGMVERAAGKETRGGGRAGRDMAVRNLSIYKSGRRDFS